MSDKIRITEDQVVSRSKGKIKYYAPDGSIVSNSTKVVQVYDTQDELDAAAQAAASLEAEVAEEIAAGNTELVSDGEQSADDPAAAEGSSKPKRSRGKRKEQMATKKKAAGKKAAKKGVTRTASNGALIRTVAGREHDISGYEKVKNASGHTSYDNGDDTATALRGKTLEEVYTFAAKKLKEDEKALRAKYKHLNAGMQRMSLGNRLRKVANAKAA